MTIGEPIDLYRIMRALREMPNVEPPANYLVRCSGRHHCYTESEILAWAQKQSGVSILHDFERWWALQMLKRGMAVIHRIAAPKDFLGESVWLLGGAMFDNYQTMLMPIPARARWPG